jgi:membrane protease YdiL (CAAX protease family)
MMFAFGLWLQAACDGLGLSTASQPSPLMQDFVSASAQLRSWGVAAVVLFAGLMPAAGEELFFRGFLGRGLVARRGILQGVLLTSLLFGALHLHPIQSLTAILGGMVEHFLYFGSRSLLAPIIRHALHNCMVVLVGTFASGSRALRTLEQAGHLPLLLLAAAFAAAAIGGLVYCTRTRWLLPDGSTWSPGYATAEMPPVALGAQPHRSAASPSRVATAAGIYLAFVAILVGELVWR